MSAIRFEMLDPHGQGFVCLGEQRYKVLPEALQAWQRLPTRWSGSGEMFACLIDSSGRVTDTRPVADHTVEAFLALPLDSLIEDAMLLHMPPPAEGRTACL
jgi:hypothetical protein